MHTCRLQAEIQTLKAENKQKVRYIAFLRDKLRKRRL
jgi:hypothetical protein